MFFVNNFKKISILLPLSILGLILAINIPKAGAQSGSSIAINWNDEHQEIDGFGGAIAWYGQNIYDLSVEDQQELLDLVFTTEDRGIGLNIVRLRIPAFKFNPAPGEWDWTQDNSQIWLVNEAKKRGVTMFWSACWTAPAWMKTNNEIDNGGYLKQENYQDYADLLSRYLREYKTRFNIDFYGISPQNEPGEAVWQSMEWHSPPWRSQGDEPYHAFYIFVRDYLQPTFERDNIQQKVILPEMWGWMFEAAEEIVNDSTTAQFVDILGGHGYYDVNWQYGTGNYTMGSVARKWKQMGGKLWQTETSWIRDTEMGQAMMVARHLHNSLTSASEVAAWHWWSIWNNTGDGGELIQIFPGYEENGEMVIPATYEVKKRFWSFGNYSKFIRRGWIRIGTQESLSGDVGVSAFKDPNSDSFVIIIVNFDGSEKNITVNLNGCNAGKVTPWITSPALDLARQSDIALANNSFSANLPATSVTSFVGGSGMTPSPSPPVNCRADFNNNNEVDIDDLLILISDWLGNGLTDINNDSKTNGRDFAGALAELGTNCD